MFRAMILFQEVLLRHIRGRRALGQLPHSEQPCKESHA
jgi:hypothetical protein